MAKPDLTTLLSGISVAGGSARSAKLNEKRLKLRKQYWPDVPEAALWVRHGKKGFITIPRTMPLLLLLLDDMSKNKPLSSTYLSLWCRTFDDCMVTITNPGQVAFESGFSGQRGVQTWAGRMRRLEDLGFIYAKPGASGPYSHVLILNPYLVVNYLKNAGVETMQEAKINALLGRASEIGADDLDALLLEEPVKAA